MAKYVTSDANGMKLKVNFLKPFSDAVGSREIEEEIDGSTISDLLDHLVSAYPKLRDELYEDDGELTDYFIIFVNDRPINALDGLETVLKDGDEILFFIPISGG